MTALAPVLAAYAAGYAALAHRVWRRRGVVRPLRAAAFALGLAAVAAALASPLDRWADDGSLVAHMAQHELLLNVAPVLLLLGLDAQLAAPLTRAVGGPVARRSRGLRAWPCWVRRRWRSRSTSASPPRGRSPRRTPPPRRRPSCTRWST